MSALILSSLEIRRFRAFHHLRIEQLGRINLIVGKNNVGKSCLLEALQLYANRARPTLIGQIFGAHDEDTRSSRSRSSSPDYNVEEVLSIVKYLFHGRRDITGPVEPIEIGPINSPEEKLQVSIEFYTSKADEEGSRTLQPVLFDELATADNPTPRFSIQLGRSRNVTYPIDFRPLTSRLLGSDLKEINCVFTAANGLTKRRIAELWDKIALTDLEKEVLTALRIIAPGLEAISIVGESNSIRERFPIVKVAGISEPLPIRSLGDGMQRLLGIALALVNAKDGLLLIDEIENGLHYSIQTDLWRLIFQLAQKLNVQVFATSHSWDCISSFQQAAQENEQENGMLIRLEHHKGEVSATLFDVQKLAVATQEQIEVR